MSNDPVSGQPEAQPRPSAFRTVEGDAKAAAIDIEDAVKRALAGVERWYAQHFHHAVQTGTAPIPADQKAALVQAVTSAVASKE